MKRSTASIFLLSLVLLFFIAPITKARGQFYIPVTVTPGPTRSNLQLETIPFITTTPMPTRPPAYTTVPPGGGAPPVGGQPPGGTAPTGPAGSYNPTKSYCIDDEGSVPGNEACDDASRFNIQKGSGGIAGSCATVIEWGQRIMDSLQLSGNLWNNLANPFTNCNYTAQATNPYISTFTVIDAYNLAGLHEISRSTHISGTDMQNWWKSAPGYRHVDFTGDSIQSILPSITPGYVMFLGSHVGIVNSIEVDANGNGWISILHSGTSYWLGVILVANWRITNTPANFPVTGFGGR